jgi:hypothetical protein
MGVEDNSYSISNLTTDNTFYNWYTKTNNEIITKLNYLKVYEGLSGDGVVVGITANGGKYKFSISDLITKGVTFNGPIKFNNSVEFNSSTDLSTVAVKIPLTSGVTSGNIVRIDSSNGGVTFAIANSQSNSEVFGVVSHNTASNTVVKVAGIIDNTLFSDTISNMLKVTGATLSKGTVYFLDSVAYGGVTVNDQVQYGTVSKPMILGITGNQGVILPYRGIANTGATLGFTADLDNNTLSLTLYTTKHLDTSAPVESGVDSVKIGSPVYSRFNDSILGLNLGEIGFIHGETFAAQSYSVSTSRANANAQDFVILYENEAFTRTSPYSAWDSYMSSKYGLDETSYPSEYYEASGNTIKKHVSTGVSSNRKDVSFVGIISNIYDKNSTTGSITVQITTPGGSFVVNDTDLSNVSRLLYDANIDYVKTVPAYSVSDDCCDHAPCENKFSSISVLNFNTTGWNGSNFQNNFYSTTNLVGAMIGQNPGYYIERKQLDGGNIFYPRIYREFNLIPVDPNCVFNESSSGAAATEDGTNSFQYLSSPLGLGGLSGGIEYDNFLINGRFDVWQRGYSSTGITGLSAKSTPLADRWFRIDRDYTTAGITNGKSVTNYTITRQEFLPNQSQVSGSPKYYLSLTHQYTGSNKPTLENVTYNPYQFTAATMTLSFYARCGFTGATMSCYYAQYENSGAFKAGNTITDLDTTVYLGSSWNRYSIPFTITATGFTLSAVTDGMFGVGFKFNSISQAVDIANVRLDLGNTPGVDVPVDLEIEIERCSDYYFRTYPYNVSTGNTDSNTYHELTIGNLTTTKEYIVRYPSPMVKTPNSVTLYSNKTGDINEAYNYSAKKDMKMTSGSVSVCPWNASLKGYRVAALNAPTITVPYYGDSHMIVSVDNGAFSMDTLQFHYVVDSDISMDNT